VLDVNGGTTINREAQLDIDATLVADRCEISGNGAIDVAAGLTVYGGDVIFEGSSTLKFRKTGSASGVFKSGSPP